MALRIIFPATQFHPCTAIRATTTQRPDRTQTDCARVAAFPFSVELYPCWFRGSAATADAAATHAVMQGARGQRTQHCPHAHAISWTTHRGGVRMMEALDISS